MSLLIVPIDYSANAEKALDAALLLAYRTGSQVELLHVVDLTAFSGMPKIIEMVMNDRKEEEANLKNLAHESIAALGIEPGIRWRVKLIYTAENFFDGIIKRFRQAKAKLVVMGTHGVTGMADKIFGSNTANLIGKAKVPVLAIPPQWSPSTLLKLSVCATPEQASRHGKLASKWGAWLKCETEAFYITALPVTGQGAKSPIPFKIVPSPIETPLYEDLVEYSKGLKNEALLMFVHERSFFKKIIDSSITEKVAGLIEIPLLALPVKK